MLLVTGATGFIGRNLIELTRLGTIRILARKTSNIQPFKNKKSIEITYGDLENNIGLNEALSNVQIVIHCAARTIGANYIKYYRTNTIGTAHLIQAMKTKNVKKILFLSSNAACGPCTTMQALKETDIPNPISFYGKSKQLAENIIIKSGINYVILRPGAVYGPHDIEILKYIKLINRGICPIVGHGEKYLNFIYVADLVELISKIIKKNFFDNQIYFVSDGSSYKFNGVVDEISKILGVNVLKLYIPEPVAHLYALLNDVFLPEYKKLIWRDKIKELAQDRWLSCNEKVIAQYNFRPIYNLKQGLKKTINWYKENNLLIP